MIRCAALLPFAAALDCVWRSSVHGASGWADASCTRLQAKDAARLPVEDLPRALQQLPKLMELHLSSLQLGDRRFEDLCKVFMQGHHRLLERLYLAHNNLGTPGALALAQSLPKLPNLKVLNLPENAIRAPGAAALAEALQSTPSLEQLVLAGNGIGVAGAQAVAQAMPQLRQLQDLHLSRNLLGTQGALALARALHSGHGPALEWLSLSENSVGDVGLQALAVGLRRTAPGWLPLWGTRAMDYSPLFEVRQRAPPKPKPSLPPSETQREAKAPEPVPVSVLDMALQQEVASVPVPAPPGLKLELPTEPGYAPPTTWTQFEWKPDDWKSFWQGFHDAAAAPAANSGPSSPASQSSRGEFTMPAKVAFATVPETSGPLGPPGLEKEGDFLWM